MEQLVLLGSADTCCSLCCLKLEFSGAVCVSVLCLHMRERDPMYFKLFELNAE